MIHRGDCLEVLRSLPDSSCDSLVTDPPAGISFMGKAWDDDKGGRKQWIAWMAQVMSECMRVMKPGAHGLVWAIPRTSHWTATALEDAGFEIRDVVTHLFGSGFPKSLDISKAIDKAAGAERVVTPTIARKPGQSAPFHCAPICGACGNSRNGTSCTCAPDSGPATALAKEWQGWGTALKPASEHWILVRKPISEKTVAKNVEKWGVGGINIDGCRVEAADVASLAKNWDRTQSVKAEGNTAGAMGLKAIDLSDRAPTGRFPANLVLSCVCEDDQHDAFCPVHVLDEQSGNLRARGNKTVKDHGADYDATSYQFGGRETGWAGDSGGASRFFYVAKPSKRERNAGCEGLPEKLFARSNGGKADVERGIEIDRSEVGSGFDATYKAHNHHPTVKPIKLMRYLIRMITPKGGVVLDPFTGSGTTGVAAIEEGMRFVGIEREPEYVAIAEKRIEYALV